MAFWTFLVGSTLGIVFGTVEKASHHAPYRRCPLIIAKISHLGPKVPYLNLEDFCVVEAAPIGSTISIMESDPTGAFLVKNWERVNEMIDRADYYLKQFEGESGKILSATLAWKNEFPRSSTIKSRSEGYHSSYNSSQNAVRQLAIMHKAIPGSIAKELRRLGSNIRRRGNSFGPTTYALFDFWFNAIPGLSIFSPAGGIRFDLSFHALNMTEEMKRMVTQTTSTMKLIGEVEAHRRELSREFFDEFEERKQRCFPESDWYGLFTSQKSTEKQDPFCTEWIPKDVHQMLSKAAGPITDLARAQLMTVHDYYTGSAAHLENASKELLKRNNYTELRLVMGPESFRKACELISDEMEMGAHSLVWLGQPVAPLLLD